MIKDRIRIEQPTMSPAEFRRAYEHLGLTDIELAKMLGFSNAQHVRRLRADPDKAYARPISAMTIRLIHAYLSGYRPPDWPNAEPGM